MMTEPDLVTIGERACIDDGMVIAHLNTKGEFTLGPINIGKACVVRCGARTQQSVIIAPCFKGRWDFYSNRKRAGFDLPALEHVLCGENMILDKLRYARRAANL